MNNSYLNFIPLASTCNRVNGMLFWLVLFIQPQHYSCVFPAFGWTGVHDIVDQRCFGSWVSCQLCPLVDLPPLLLLALAVRDLRLWDWVVWYILVWWCICTCTWYHIRMGLFSEDIKRMDVIWADGPPIYFFCVCAFKKIFFTLFLSWSNFPMVNSCHCPIEKPAVIESCYPADFYQCLELMDFLQKFCQPLFSSDQFSLWWCLCAWESPYALHPIFQKFPCMV